MKRKIFYRFAKGHCKKEGRKMTNKKLCTVLILVLALLVLATSCGVKTYQRSYSGTGKLLVGSESAPFVWSGIITADGSFNGKFMNLPATGTVTGQGQLSGSFTGSGSAGGYTSVVNGTFGANISGGNVSGALEGTAILNGSPENFTGTFEGKKN